MEGDGVSTLVLIDDRELELRVSSGLVNFSAWAIKSFVRRWLMGIECGRFKSLTMRSRPLPGRSNRADHRVSGASQCIHRWSSICSSPSHYHTAVDGSVPAVDDRPSDQLEHGSAHDAGAH